MIQGKTKLNIKEETNKTEVKKERKRPRTQKSAFRSNYNGLELISYKPLESCLIIIKIFTGQLDFLCLFLGECRWFIL